MGTRARIAVQHPHNGTFASIYTHWDGYPSHHGKILLQHYTQRDKVYALMALGDLSILGREIGEKRDFYSREDDMEAACLSFGRDRGETGVEAVTSNTLDELKALTEECGGEWLYVFDANDTWYVAKGGVGYFGAPTGVTPGDLRLLADVLAEIDEQEKA